MMPGVVVLHPWNTDFEWEDRTAARHARPPTRCATSTARLRRRARPRRPRHGGRGRRQEIDAFEAEADAFLQPADGRPGLDLRDGRHHLLGAPGGALGAAARPHPPRAHRRDLRRPHRPRREPVLGPGRVQEAGEAPPVPLAPGQRLRVRRAAAVPHGVAGAHRRHRRQRLPVGRARACTASARSSTPSSSRSAGSACPSPTARSRPRCRPAAPWCSPRSPRTSPARTPPTRCARPTSSSTPPPAPRCCAATRRRPARRAASGPTPPTGSTPSCAAAADVTRTSTTMSARPRGVRSAIHSIRAAGVGSLVVSGPAQQGGCGVAWPHPAGDRRAVPGSRRPVDSASGLRWLDGFSSVAVRVGASRRVSSSWPVLRVRGTLCIGDGCTHAEAVAAFEHALANDEPSLTFTIDDVRRELVGRDLACWCPLDQPCHADVLLRIANTSSNTTSTRCQATR